MNKECSWNHFDSFLILIAGSSKINEEITSFEEANSFELGFAQ